MESAHFKPDRQDRKLICVSHWANLRNYKYNNSNLESRDADKIGSHQITEHLSSEMRDHFEVTGTVYKPEVFVTEQNGLNRPFHDHLD